MSNKTTAFSVALAGSPNCGKTSIFNGLTGAQQHVGNYPGVTVERRVGYYRYEDKSVEVRDLPGSYSLSSFSPEEEIAQRELMDEHPHVVALVSDATNLKRSLVLLAQMMQISRRIVLVLNMSDEARKSGQKIDLSLLETIIGIPVVETVGHKGTGLETLKAQIAQTAARSPGPSRLRLGERTDDALDELAAPLRRIGIDESTVYWVANKILQNDPFYVDRVRGYGQQGAAVIQRAETLRTTIESLVDDDIVLYIQQRYYGFVDGLLKEVLVQSSHIDTRVLSDRIDAVVVNRLAGIPIFLAIMYGIFWITFTLGATPMTWIESLFGFLQERIDATWPASFSPALLSLIVDGIIGGVGGVLVFLPNIVLLFFCLAILQDSGYMSRAAFLSDRLMHRFGLHGRSFIPMITGFGCSIPGIMATRTIENHRDRLTTMLVLPLMSCGARLPIWMLLIPAFFRPSLHATMLFTIYFIGILLALLLALLLKKTLMSGQDAPFVMELPPYRMPTLRSVTGRMMNSSWAYVKKAGTIILAISIAMWFLTTFPRMENTAPTSDIAADAPEPFANLEHSFAGRIGKFIEPAIAPLGFDWKIGVATIGAFAAKEVFISQMGVIYALGDTDENDTSLVEALRRDYSPLAGFSLMLFLLISAPCMATIAVTRKESGSWKWAALQLAGLTSVAYLLSLTVYQVGSFLPS